MNKQIRVLLVEDSEDDAELILQTLRRSGYDTFSKRVENRVSMENSLANHEWDIIIADYKMPEFDGIKALLLVNEKGCDVPFILVSGTIGEDVAVDAMKAGADDYVMKDNLHRLVPAIRRELKEFEKRRESKRIEDAIQALVKSALVKTGEDSFKLIVTSVQEWLNAEYVCLGMIMDNDNVKVLSIFYNEKYHCNCVYNLKGTLCERVIKDTFYHCRENAAELLPSPCEKCANIVAEGFLGISIRNENNVPIGIIWAASHNILYLPPRAMEVMEILAAKAGSEIKRIQMVEELQKSEQHHRRLLNSLKDGIYQSEPHEDGVFTWVNNAFAEIFGYKNPEEVVGTKVKDIYINPDDRMRVIGKLEKNGTLRNFESLCKKKNSENIYTERTSSLIRDDKGKPMYIEGVIRDITERKRMEDTIRSHNEELKLLVEKRTKRVLVLERQRIEREKLVLTGQLAAGFAHEINNPLSCIEGGFMLIKDSVPDSHKYYKYVSIIEQEISRIGRTTKQMFDLSRPHEGTVSDFDSLKSIHETIYMLKSLSNNYGVTLNLNCFETTVKVTMCEDYFKQVLFNIIKNAIEASHKDCIVDVNVKCRNDRLNIIITDQGDGIPKESRSRIFEPFFTTKDKDSGSGLGLGLCVTKNMIESMGGALGFRSEKGKGTTFVIALPTNIINSINVNV